MYTFILTTFLVALFLYPIYKKRAISNILLILILVGANLITASIVNRHYYNNIEYVNEFSDTVKLTPEYSKIIINNDTSSYLAQITYMYIAKDTVISKNYIEFNDNYKFEKQDTGKLEIILINPLDSLTKEHIEIYQDVIPDELKDNKWANTVGIPNGDYNYKIYLSSKTDSILIYLINTYFYESEKIKNESI